MTNRVAVVRGDRVLTTMVAPDWEDELAYSRWIAAWTAPGRAFEGCLLQVLREDEVVNPDDRRSEDGTFSAPLLPMKERIAAANEQTKATIVSGYWHSFDGGKQQILLSTSETAQKRWFIDWSLAKEGMLPLPFEVNSADDKSSYVVETLEDLRAIVVGIFASVRKAGQADVAAKKAIRATPDAATLESVEADEKLAEALAEGKK